MGEERVLGRSVAFWAAAVFAVALAARLAYWAYAGTRVGGDTPGYLAWCASAAADPVAALRGGIGIEYLGFTAPLCGFLGLTGNWFDGWVALQVLLSSAACALLFDAGRRLAGPTAGLVAGLGAAALWETLQWDVYVLSDSLFVAAMSAALWGLARHREAPSPRTRLLAFAALAWVALSRPVGVPIVGLWLLWDLWPRRSTHRLGLLPPVAAAALIVAGVLAVAVVSSRPAWGEAWLVPVWSTGTLVHDDPAFTYAYAPRPADGTVGFALANLDHLVVMGALKAALLLLPVVGRFSLVHNAVNLVTLVPLLALGLWGLARAVRERPGLARLLGSPLLAIAGIVALTFIDFDWRYRAPMGPPLALLAGYVVATTPALAGLRARAGALLAKDLDLARAESIKGGGGRGAGPAGNSGRGPGDGAA